METFTPPLGTTFHTVTAVPLATLSPCICRVVSFLQHELNVNQLLRYDDWLEHDGLHFKRGEMNIHNLFRIIETGREIFEATPGDDSVFVGIGPAEGDWYLRFRAECDDEDYALIGRFGITLPDALAARFRTEIIPQFGCAIEEESSADYFRRITV